MNGASIACSATCTDATGHAQAMDGVKGLRHEGKSETARQTDARGDVGGGVALDTGGRADTERERVCV